MQKVSATGISPRHVRDDDTQLFQNGSLSRQACGDHEDSAPPPCLTDMEGDGSRMDMLNDRWHVTVKNTFVDIALPAAVRETRRRAQSMPAMSIGGVSSADGDPDASTLDLARRRARIHTDGCKKGRGSSDGDFAPPSLRQEIQAQGLKYLALHVSEKKAGDSTTFGPGSTTPLNGGAKLFRPLDSHATLFARSFDLEVAGILSAMRATLIRNGLAGNVASVHILADPKGWSIDDHYLGAGKWYMERTIAIQVGSLRVPDEDQLLSLAKTTLLREAEKSPCVYIVGYEAQPFVPVLHGFRASLGAMRDVSKACWDVYKTSVCKRGPACDRQHPPCTILVHVAVVETASSSSSVRV